MSETHFGSIKNFRETRITCNVLRVAANVVSVMDDGVVDMDVSLSSPRMSRPTRNTGRRRGESGPLIKVVCIYFTHPNNFYRKYIYANAVFGNEKMIHTPRQKSIRALEIFRVQKLILNATS